MGIKQSVRADSADFFRAGKREPHFGMLQRIRVQMQPQAQYTRHRRGVIVRPGDVFACFIRQRNDRIDAVGMRLDMVSEQYELLNDVKAHYETS